MMIRLSAIIATVVGLGATPVMAQSALEQGLKALLEAAIESQLKPKEEEPEKKAAKPKPKPNQTAAKSPRTTAQAQSKLDMRFDAAELTRAEKRILQAGLALEGHYNALLDGAWGRGSQGALEKMTQAEHQSRTPTWDHTVQLQDRLSAEVTRNGWQPTGSRDNAVSLLLPMRTMRVANARRGVAWQSVQRDIQVRILPQSVPEAVTLANAIADRHEGRGAAYFRQSGDKIVVSAELSDGGGIYMRNFETRGALRTALIEWDRTATSVAKLAIASLRAGPQRGLELPQNGRLNQLVLASKAPRVPAQTGQTGFWPEEEEPSVVLREFNQGAKTNTSSVKRSVRGNGVYVNNTDVLTANIALRGCKQVFLGAGVPAKIVKRDSTTGLALVTSAARSTDWIDLARTKPAMDENLIAVGYSGKSENAALRAERTRVAVLSKKSDGPGSGALVRIPKSTQLGSLLLSEDRGFAGMMIHAPHKIRGLRGRYYASAASAKSFLTKNKILHASVPLRNSRDMTETRLQTVTTRVSCAD